MKINGSTTVKELIDIAAYKLGEDPKSVRLIYSNLSLTKAYYDKPIEELGMENNSTLAVVYRNKGGTNINI